MPDPSMAELEDHYPSRDDQVLAWLKDRTVGTTLLTPGGVFALITEYELAADEGISLNELVNGRTEQVRTTRKKKVAKKREKK